MHLTSPPQAIPQSSLSISISLGGRSKPGIGASPIGRLGMSGGASRSSTLPGSRSATPGTARRGSTPGADGPRDGRRAATPVGGNNNFVWQPAIYIISSFLKLLVPSIK